MAQDTHGMAEDPNPQSRQAAPRANSTDGACASPDTRPDASPEQARSRALGRAYASANPEVPVLNQQQGRAAPASGDRKPRSFSWPAMLAWIAFAFLLAGLVAYRLVTPFFPKQ